MKTIVIASTNQGKIREVQQQLNLNGLQILPLNHFSNFSFPDVKESGSTFKENALIKARAYFDILKIPVIADDSGLVVPVINGEPGVYSARYAGPEASDYANNTLLLEKLKNIPDDHRDAFFQIFMVFKDTNAEHFFEGRCYGKIITSAKGSNGFGYDPVFYIPELKKTMAELTLDEKIKISHRGKALAELKMFLKKTLQMPDF